MFSFHVQYKPAPHIQYRHHWCRPKDADDKTPFSRLVMAVPFVGKATVVMGKSGIGLLTFLNTACQPFKGN